MNRTRRSLLVTWTAAIVTLVVLEAASRFVGPVESKNNLERLLDYQQSKLGTLPEQSIVFVGDSSLGSAIDARALSDQLGKPVYNLALVGSASTIGDYYLVREALARQQKLSAVVIMHTSDLWVRKTDQDTQREIEFRFAPYSLEALSLRIARWISLVRQSKSYKKLLLARGRGFDYDPTSFDASLIRQRQVEERLAEVDYVVQGQPPNWMERRAKPLRGKLRRDRSVEQWFDRTVALCREHNVPVYVTVSPLWSQLVRRSEKHISEVSAWLREKSSETGFTLLFDRALPIPSEFVGDSEDHVHPSMKRQYTEWFADRFARHRELGVPLPLEPTPFGLVGRAALALPAPEGEQQDASP